MTRSALDDGLWRIVRNHQGCYSVTPAGRPLPAGWTAEDDAPAGRAECLARIETVWGDQRPRSLRQALKAAERA